MENKKKSRIIIGITIFCILYITLALKPLGTELHLSPEWTIDAQTSREQKENEELIPFRLGQSIGFFTEDGNVVSTISYPFNSAISNTYYALYGADNFKTTIYATDGTEAGTINDAGFPFFDEDRIFCFLPGGTAVAQYDSTGSRLWRYESYAPITSFDSSKGGSVIGFANGEIISITSDGKIDQSYAPGGSEIEVILGSGISKDGKLIACVSGQKQQRFVVSQKNGEHSKIIYHEYLPKDFTRQVLVKFNNKSDTVYYNYCGGLGIVNLQTLSSSHIPINGYIAQIEESEQNELIYVLSREDSTYTVTVLEPLYYPIATFSFTAQNAFIQVKNNSLFVGRNNKISKFTVSRR